MRVHVCVHVRVSVSVRVHVRKCEKEAEWSIEKEKENRTYFRLPVNVSKRWRTHVMYFLHNNKKRERKRNDMNCRKESDRELDI